LNPECCDLTGDGAVRHAVDERGSVVVLGDLARDGPTMPPASPAAAHQRELARLELLLDQLLAWIWNSRELLALLIQLVDRRGSNASS
jgi:hypothetical protein